MAFKILVVDDEPLIVEIIRSRLEANRYSVIESSDGLDAFEKVKSERPDLIVLDVSLPGMNGYQFVRDLRTLKEDVRETPVIIISARDSMQELFDPNDIHGFVSKPFEVTVLLDKIREALKVSEFVALKAKRALIINTDWDAVRPIRDLLEKEKIVVQVSRDAQRGIEDAVKFKPNMIFVPSKLIGMDIWELCELFRSLPTTREVPLVVYDLGNLGEESAANIKATKVISYTDHKDLIKKVNIFLKEHFV